VVAGGIDFIKKQEKKKVEKRMWVLQFARLLLSPETKEVTVGNTNKVARLLGVLIITLQ
jgi:hypothetical protein